VKKRTSNWQYIRFEDITPLIKAWDSLSHRQKIKAVKDTRWNHYPLSSWTAYSDKRYGDAISQLVRKIFLKQKDDLKILEKHSVGIFAIFLIDQAQSSTRISMAKRLMNSKDKRIRTRCVSILPLKYLHHFINDNYYSVRNRAVSRIGLDNCYSSFLPEEEYAKSRGLGNWMTYKAVKRASFDDVADLLPDLSGGKLPDRLVSAILEKIPTEDILYYLDVRGRSNWSSGSIENIIEQKIT
jgi:hypothetical protein